MEPHRAGTAGSLARFEVDTDGDTAED